MIKILKPLPRMLTVSVSGGSDSMAMLDFLRRKHEVQVAHVDHGTAYGAEAFKYVTDYCKSQSIPLLVYKVVGSKPADESWEEFWRNERYKFFHSIEGIVTTAHTLDDCIEQWVFSSLHGNPKVIPYANKNVVRPLLTNSKLILTDWCERKGVTWLEDPSNLDTKYMRNLIRHELLPIALKVNPGLAKVVKKKVLEMVG